MSEKVSVVMPAKNETTSFKNGLLDSVLSTIPSRFEPHLVVSIGGNSNLEFTDLVQEISGRNPNIHPLLLGNPPLATAYLTGLQYAQKELGANYIVEMDASGAHHPKYIPDFIRSLAEEGFDAAFSSRFSKGSAIDRYPLQRRLVSRLGTVSANLTFGFWPHWPDLTSGFESFSNTTLQQILCHKPVGTWISETKGPGHFYQTEMRVRILKNNFQVQTIPIIWGTDRAQPPTKLPARTVLQALTSLLVFKQELNSSPLSRQTNTPHES